MTRIPRLLFVLTLLIASLLAYCLLATQPTVIHSGPHPTIPEMNQAGTSERHTRLIVVCGLYGALQIALFVTALCLGIRRDRSSLLPLVQGGAAYAAVFAAMMISYRQGMDAAPIVFGLPLPTAIMVFGMWTIPVVFVLLYIARFDQWVYSDADAQQFAELKTRSRSQHCRGETQRPTDG